MHVSATRPSLPLRRVPGHHVLASHFVHKSGHRLAEHSCVCESYAGAVGASPDVLSLGFIASRRVDVSYDSDMTTTETATASELDALLGRVNRATKSLQRSTSVPGEVAGLIDSFERTLGAATPLRLEADPYLTTTLWAAAFRAEKALRHDNNDQQRRAVRIAL